MSKVVAVHDINHIKKRAVRTQPKLQALQPRGGGSVISYENDGYAQVVAGLHDARVSGGVDDSFLHRGGVVRDSVGDNQNRLRLGSFAIGVECVGKNGLFQHFRKCCAPFMSKNNLQEKLLYCMAHSYIGTKCSRNVDNVP